MTAFPACDMWRSSTHIPHMCYIFHQLSHIHYKVFMYGVFVYRGVHFKIQGPLGNSQIVGRDSCVLSPARVQGQNALIFSSQYRGLRSLRAAWLSVRDKWVRVVELCAPSSNPRITHYHVLALLLRIQDQAGWCLSRVVSEGHAYRISASLLVLLIVSWLSSGYPGKFRNMQYPW
jgi:hypothetical protein